MIQLKVAGESADIPLTFDAKKLIIAGWTGRDAETLEAHILELESLGVARPKAVPIFYRIDAGLVTTSESVQLVGHDSSGEVEAVLYKHEGALYVGVGSDHTDRKLETVSITLSKQVCAKPVSDTVWRWTDVADHWDELQLRSSLPRTGEVYQEGVTAGLRRPDELLTLYESREGTVPDGTIMFCGTLPVAGGIRFAEEMQIELSDPVRGRSLRHRYAVEALPIAEL